MNGTIGMPARRLARSLASCQFTALAVSDWCCSCPPPNAMKFRPRSVRSIGFLFPAFKWIDNDSGNVYSRTRITFTKIDMVSPRRHGSEEPQKFYSGLVRIHILYHACEEPIFGLGMIDELRRHGYKLSPGTLYPLLHGLERRGLLRSRPVRAGRWMRREYRATSAGHKALKVAKRRVRELFGEIFEAK